MWLEKKTVRPAVLLLDDEVAHLLAADRIEAAHRLVEDEQLRIVHERRRERRRAGASPSRARAPGGRSRSAIPTRSMTCDHAVAQSAAAEPREPPAERHELARRQVRVDVRVLGQEAHAPP